MQRDMGSRGRRRVGVLVAVLGVVLLAAGLPGTAAEPRQTSSAAPAFAFTAAGDYGASTRTTATLDLIGSSGVAFNLALGDLSYGNLTPESAWCDYVQSHVGATFPFELIAGNHDQDGSLGGHIDNFAACLPDRLGGLTGTYAKEYYFDYQGLARFILISPDLPLNGETYRYVIGSPHYDFVAQAIDGARAAGIPWVIAGMHKNCLSVGVKGCGTGADLMNLLVAKRVDLVLHGHDHTYQRSGQLAHSDACAAVLVGSYNAGCVADDGTDNVYPKDTGTVFVIAGTGGAGLTSIDPADPEAGYFVTWMGNNVEPRHGVLRVGISSTELSAAFVGSTTTSTFADSFTIGLPAEPTPTGTPPTATATVAAVSATPTATTSATPLATATATATSAPQTLTFTPVADTYADANAPNTTFGTATRLRVDGSPIRETYMRYDLSGLSGTVTSARVRVVVAMNGGSNGGSIATMSNTSWSETAVTYDTRPAIDGPVLSTLGAVTVGQSYEFDVTSGVTGNGLVSFGIRPNISNGVDYGSRESANPPLLIVQVAGDSASATATGTSTGTPSPTATDTPAATATSTPMGTAIATATVTTTAAETATPTGTRTSTVTAIPTATATATASTTATSTPTATIAVTATATTAASTSTPTPTASATWTPAATATSGPQTLTFTPVADTSVDASVPGTNFGTATRLRVDGSAIRETYIRFEVSGLSGTVTSARVRVLVATDGSPSGGSIAKMSNTTWSETAVTYNTRPAIDGPALSTLGSVAVGQSYEFDVTSAVSGNGTVSFGIKSSNANGVDYASRESANPPRLIVQTSG